LWAARSSRITPRSSRSSICSMLLMSSKSRAICPAGLRVSGGGGSAIEGQRRTRRQQRLVRPERPRLRREQGRAVEGRLVERVRILLLVQPLRRIGANLQAAGGHELQSAAEGECKRGAE